jgi:hypothetical protein
LNEDAVCDGCGDAGRFDESDYGDCDADGVHVGLVYARDHDYDYHDLIVPLKKCNLCY